MKKIICFLSILIISCEVSVNRQNNASDIEAAKRLSADFYKLVKEKKFTDAAKFFGSTVGYMDGLRILENVNKHIGNLDTVIYVNGSSNTTVSSKKDQDKGEYSLNFKAFYEKMEANEEIVIELINDSLKITGYHPKVMVKSTD
jgi:hypothetical protein